MRLTLLALVLGLVGCSPLMRPVDAGVPADAGTPDADAGTVDAGGGEPDAGPSSTRLASLWVSVGQLAPAFDAGTLRYSVAVPLATHAVTVVATTADARASLDVGGTANISGVESQPLGLVNGAGHVTITVSAPSGSTAYELDFAPGKPAEQGRFSSTAPSEHFGAHLAVSNDTLVVGSSGANGAAGEAVVYARTGISWAQVTKLGASNADPMDVFGRSVAIDGDTLVVGAPGEDSSAVGVNGDGTSNAASLSGAAYIFVRSGGSWVQQAYLKPSNTVADQQFGRSVAISGDVVAVGAVGDASAGTLTGAVFVYRHTGTTWAFEAYLKASNAGARDMFGSAVALSGETLVVGSPYEAGPTDATSSSGAAYVFVHAGTDWAEQKLLRASDAATQDYFGAAVAVDGDTVVVGAYGRGGVSHFQRGAAYAFARSGTAWAQQSVVTPLAPVDGDAFGAAVALSGDALVVGAYQDDSGATGVDGVHDARAIDSGAGYLFNRAGTTWTQQAYLKTSVTQADDFLGSSVGVSATSLAVGGEGVAAVFSRP